MDDEEASGVCQGPSFDRLLLGTKTVALEVF
jgi:hypothetical protein